MPGSNTQKKYENTESCWIYQGAPFDISLEQVIEDGLVGFVYLITHKESGLKYIGQKKFLRVIKRPPLKGQKRKRKETVFSDWKTYWSSGEKMKELHRKDGDAAFTREILYLCKGKALMNYLETHAQFEAGVLFSDEYLNGIVNCRINSQQVAKYADELRKMGKI